MRLATDARARPHGCHVHRGRTVAGRYGRRTFQHPYHSAFRRVAYGIRREGDGCGLIPRVGAAQIQPAVSTTKMPAIATAAPATAFLLMRSLSMITAKSRANAGAALASTAVLAAVAWESA